METAVLLGLYARLIPFDTFLLSLLFPRVVTFDTSEIAFDKLHQTHKLAPFVSPLVAGKPRKADGSVLKKFKPAYVKPKNAIDPERVLTRKAGESLGAPLSAGDRVNAIRMDTLDEQRKMILNRLEWMAAQLLRTGKITVSGEDYPTVEVDFGRDTDHTVQLSGGARWTESATRDPNGDLEDWMGLLDAPCTHIIFGKNAFSLYMDDAKSEKMLNRDFGSTTTLAMEPQQMMAAYRGRLGAGGPEVWTYSGWYEDDAGVKQFFIDEDEVMLVSTAGGGVRAHGAILDAKAEYQALELFPKSWVSDDPAVEYLMTQSAPLPVMPLIDSTLCATVTGAS